MGAFEPLDYGRSDFPTEADLVQLMCRHIRHIEPYWHDDSDGTGYFGSMDMSTWMPENEAIRRSVAHHHIMVLAMIHELRGYAALYKSPHYDEDLAGVSRSHLLDRLNRCIRWITAHHHTGERHLDAVGGQWGDAWISSMRAGYLANAAFWVWDDLDEDVRDRALRLLAYEADRFLGVDPPDGRWYDTKAEENAWDAMVIAWAVSLQPDHPHADAWLERGKVFAMNTFTTDRDRVDTSLVDGRAVRDWVSTQTAHSDLTVENHGSFHPGYLGCGGLLLSGRLAFLKTGKIPPPQYLFSVREVWDVLKRFYLCNGFSSYPSGQDWGYHWPLVQVQAVVMAGEFGDEIAGHLFREQVRYADEAMRFAGDGRFDGRIPHVEGGRNFQFQTAGMGALGEVVMAGLPSVEGIEPDAFRRKQVGCVDYPYVWMQVRRSRQGTVSFSWRSLSQRVMGTVVPAGGESIFGADEDGLVGRFGVDGRSVMPRVVSHTDHTTERGFTTTGEIEYADGAIRQQIAVAALEDGETVVLIDLTKADPATNVTLNEAFGIYPMNDFMNDNHVSIAYEGGRSRVRGVGGKARVIETMSPWMRIAGCLGIATSGLPLFYSDAADRNTPARWKSVLQDRVYILPERSGSLLRDFCAVLRLGRGGARRAVEGPVQIESSNRGTRAYRFSDARRRDTVIVANLTTEDVETEVEGLGTAKIPAMDSQLLCV